MSAISSKPSVSPGEAEEVCRNIFGIESKALPLPGERDQNFLISAGGEKRFVLKISNYDEDALFVEAQNAALNYVKEKINCPVPIASKDGKSIALYTDGSGNKSFVRLLNYLSGKPFGEIKHHNEELLRGIGAFTGKLSRALGGFDHPAVHRKFDWDFANALEVIEKYKNLIPDAGLKNTVEKISAEFAKETLPLLKDLRKSVVHNDANDFNLIIDDGGNISERHKKVSGVVDFGDMVYSYTVSDVAVAAAYSILNKKDPLSAAMKIVEAYNREFPLRENEISALFNLIRMRLCVSVCMAAHQQAERPGDAYLSVSQSAIKNTLPKLAATHPRFVEAAFRSACGLVPVRKESSVTEWIKRNRNNFVPVLGFEMASVKTKIFDLSVSSPMLSGDHTKNTEQFMTKIMFDLMKDENAAVGIGLYDEARLVYTSPLFAKSDLLAEENRTVHLGIDLFADAGTPVYAPLDGTIYFFNYNSAPLDYGNLIILKHETDDGNYFFTLYGHLSHGSIKGLSKGKKISKGEKLAEFGSPDMNGGWTPHLHFQIILDLLEMDHDYPGVCRPGERGVWKSFSPDPNLILNIPENILPEKKPAKEETLAKRKKYLGRNLSIGYNDPLKIDRGWMQYIFDSEGRKYLDAYNNVPHVGHCHPKVVEAGQRQMAVLNTNTRYLHDHINTYAEKLTATLPEKLSVCYFVNSASEANELALRLARTYTKQKNTIVLEAAYHGHTTSLIDISQYKHAGPGGCGAPDWVHTAPIPDVYRGKFKSGDPEAGLKYASAVKHILENLKIRDEGVAAFIAETCPSVGGQIFLPEGYLANVYNYVRDAGGVCIADEVQTGYGRIGTHFYAFEAHGVVPDIVVLGKPIGNGHPIAAVITTAEIAGAFDNGMEFFSTFGGNNVSCAVGISVLDVMKEENLQNRALNTGEIMLQGLNLLKEKYEIMGDVRGSGLFLGVELVNDSETLKPAAEEASYIVNRMREKGILTGTDGPYHNVIKIRPPMQFSEYDAETLVNTFAEIMKEEF